jgi:hypothetical protein
VPLTKHIRKELIGADRERGEPHSELLAINRLLNLRTDPLNRFMFAELLVARNARLHNWRSLASCQ